MSEILLDLNDYVVTDSGEVVMKYGALVERLRMQSPVPELAALACPEIAAYNQRREPEHMVTICHLDGVVEGPLPDCYDFLIPSEFLELDIDVYLTTRLGEQFPEQPEYAARLVLELKMMHQRHMENFIRTLIYIIDVLDRNHAVRGIGRGSACASLMLFLIGVHMVDPVLYDIPIGEFLR